MRTILAMEQKSTNIDGVSKNPKEPILEDLITNFSQERFDYVFIEVNKLLYDYPTSRRGNLPIVAAFPL